MRVDVERDVDLGVPQSLLNDLGMDPLLEHEAGGGVTQVVEPDVWQPGLRKNPFECCKDVPRILRGAGRRRED